MEKPEEKNNEPRKKNKNKKLLMILIGVVVIIVAVIVMLSTIQPPSPYLEVNDIMGNYAKYTDDEIEVVGNVGEIVTENNTMELKFELVDRDNADKVIWVEATTQPDGFITGKDVVVTGTLNSVDGDYFIKAKSIEVGCPSKYE